MLNQGTTIVDVVLVLLSLVALALVALAMLWRRWRARQVSGSQLALGQLQLPLSPEQERAVRARIAELERQQAAPANGHAAPAASNGAALDWLGALVGAIHALILGQQRSGKTVIAHEIATRRARQGQQVLVADPDARPGMWPGCTVAGGGDDWPAIDTMLAEVQAEIAKRRQLRGRMGRRRFPPLTLVLSDAADIMNECEHARAVFAAALRRGGKLDVHLIVDVQDKQVGTLNIPGASHLLKNFDEEISVRREGTRRIVTYKGQVYDIPQLTDPEELADAHAQRHPPTLDADRLLAQLFAEPQPQPQPRQHAPESAAAGSASTSTSAPAPTMPAPAWEAEIAWVCPDNGRSATKGQVMELLRAARTEPTIVKELWAIDGTAGARYKAALDIVARIRAAALTGELVARS